MKEISFTMIWNPSDNHYVMARARMLHDEAMAVWMHQDIKKMPTGYELSEAYWTALDTHWNYNDDVREFWIKQAERLFS